MDFSEFPTGGSSSSSSGKPSPRRELQGPRPMPLKVRKDSYKVKKPPVAPQPPQHRPPVIIYTVSPKVIHTNPSEFMSLVQRLTGASSSASASASASSNSIEKASASSQVMDINNQRLYHQLGFDNSSTGGHDVLFDQLGFDGTRGRSAATAVTGILSPIPASLPMISPNFFSTPSVDINSSLSFLHDLSPANYYNSFSNNRNFVDNSFLVSPSNLLSASVVPSPAAGYWDLFNQYDKLN